MEPPQDFDDIFIKQFKEAAMPAPAPQPVGLVREREPLGNPEQKQNRL
jgi:hypothetical protein